MATARQTVPRLVTGIMIACAVLGMRTIPAAAAAELVSCWTGLTWPYAADPFIPSCRVEMTDVRDAEFNSVESMVTWRVDPLLNRDGSVKAHGSIAIAPVRKSNGMIMADRTIYVTEAHPVHNRFLINGPEWSDSQRGREIYYSCYTMDEQAVQVCRISRDATGTWRNHALPDTVNRSSRNPSFFAGDPIPKILYEIHSGPVTNMLDEGFGYRFDTESGPYTGKEWGVDFGQGRFLPDGSGIIHMQYPGPEYRFKQPAIYDIADDRDRGILSDDVRRGDPFAWLAPELDGQMAFVVVANGATSSWFEIYKQTENNQWDLWTTIDPICSEFSFNYSAESFVSENRSYIFASSFRDEQRKMDSIVWIATVDPALRLRERVNRLISEPSCNVSTTRKNDPEMITRWGRVGRVYFVDFGSGQ